MVYMSIFMPTIALGSVREIAKSFPTFLLTGYGCLLHWASAPRLR